MEASAGLVAALVRGSFLIERTYAETARAQGITPQQGVLICALMPGALGMGELSEVLGLAKSSLTGLVSRTEANGLVIRSADPDDTRAVNVALTSTGAAVAEEFHTAVSSRISALVQELSIAERDALGVLLHRMLGHNAVPVVFTDQRRW
ncbi:MarR family winged helix-turn-helix transcriptional regulator [Kineosporia babensis]|uniref:MarR family transcriptional regulator n=1 Tax=Kineosporia babensis TaxID=499548 RepID=A0A9X1STG1_9ACTN|nr:MarR family transcriptional regulator [Kineosporia babensis]MCD5311772.1 MarR family transcriptional regulator [Kineosporia babensis]